MFISDFAIRRPIVTITAMVALVAFGIAALLNLQTDEFPDVQQPVVAVTIPYPGASPETVEREVIDPLEESFSSISGVDWSRTEAHATDGLAQFVVFFDFEKNIQQASQDIRDAISTKRADLPTEMKEPILSRLDPADMPVLSIALTSTTVPVPILTRLADPGILRELRSVAGVAEANLVGGITRELSVNLRPADLQAAGISVSQVVQALAAQNLAAPVGNVTGPLEEQSIRLKGRLETPEEFQQMVVAERGGQQIRLGQVATVVDGTEEQRDAAFYSGKTAVGIDVKKTKGYSTTQVTKALERRVAEIQQTLPAGVKFEIVQNAGVRVAHAVKNVQEALVEGALLTVLVVFLFLNSWRSTVITGLALPVSVLASFIAVWAFGFTLNTMSLLGLSLAIGILIDDAIVVRENIVRHIEMGKDHLTASHEGTDEIGLAVAATTFSIVAVFVPVAFMYGVAGQWFKPFALTIACAVLVSLFVSFSLDPMLSAFWPDPQTEAHERKNPVARALDRFNRWFDRTADRYKDLVAWALDHRAAMVAIAVGSFFAALTIPGQGILAALVLVAGVAALVWLFNHRMHWLVKTPAFVAIVAGAFALSGRVPVVGKLGASFVPVSDRSEINLIVQAPPGASLDYTVTKTEEIARTVRQLPEVAYTYTTVGTAIPMHSPAVDQALVYIRLTPKADRKRSQDELGRVLRDQLKRVGGADVSVFTSGFGGAFKEIQVQMKGPDAKVLTNLAEQAAALVKQVPGAVDVGLSTRGQKPELEVTVNRGLAGQLGVTVGEIAQSLRAAFAGIDAGDWVDPSGETRDVTVRLAPEARRNAADLRQLPLVVQTGQGAPATLPLGQVASIQQGLGPAQIDHINREKVVNVEANTQGRDLTGVMTDIQAKLKALHLPPGYEIVQGGQARDQAEVFTRIFTALGVAVLLMYLILVVQFGSFLDPLAILISLPLSLIGVVLALWITGDTLNLMSLIGVILLMGIVAKNAILLIDFAKWNHEKGMPLREALIEAGRVRLRPIIMTTFALIAGMIPVAIGSGEGADFRAPLGRAVIGGTLTATFLTLLVIPTIYEILDGWRAGLFAFFRRRFGHGEPVPAHGPHHPAPEPAGGVD
ncbi:MAG TPA: efflux RND transporter permease subunit [Gemmatimonadales bacterium]|nr:efflux RND transporter permease subunit [Gemmatimonadales bacterium]